MDELRYWKPEGLSSMAASYLVFHSFRETLTSGLAGKSSKGGRV